MIEAARGTGLGKGLLFKALESLRDIGYAYGVIGGVGPREFYEKNCGAIEIPAAIRSLRGHPPLNFFSVATSEHTDLPERFGR